MANLTNCMQSCLKHNLSQCLLLVSTSSISVLTTKSGEFVVFLRNCVASMCKLIYLNVKKKKKNFFFFFFFNKRIVPNKARIGRHFSGNKYAYRDVY